MPFESKGNEDDTGISRPFQCLSSSRFSSLPVCLLSLPPGAYESRAEARRMSVSRHS